MNPSQRPVVGPREVVVTELDQRFLRGLYSENHAWTADEPAAWGGTDGGPTPYDLLLMSLGACTSMTLRLFARHNRLPLDDVTVRLTHRHVHEEDAEECGGGDRRLDVIAMEIRLQGALTDEQRETLLAIAANCPLHRTLTGEVEIQSRLAGPSGD